MTTAPIVRISLFVLATSLVASGSARAADRGAMKTLAQKLSQKRTQRQIAKAEHEWSTTVEEVRKVAKELKKPLRLGAKPLVLAEEPLSYQDSGWRADWWSSLQVQPAGTVKGTKRLEVNEHGLQEIVRTTTHFNNGEKQVNAPKATTIELPGRVGRLLARMPNLIGLAADPLPEDILNKDYRTKLGVEQVRKARKDWMRDVAATP